jgi:hypothetical protein
MPTPKLLVALFPCVLLGGCASFEGMPRPVLTDATVDAMIGEYRPDKVIEAMAVMDPGSNMKGRNTYRNRVIMAYLTAIDARYDTFKRELSSTGKGGHFAGDTVILGLTGLASMLSGSAQELAAAATAVGGVRSSFDKEVLVDQTMPVLISLMDSKRLNVRADIMRGLSQDEGVYTIQEGFSDLMRYQSAGSIDAAVQQAAIAAAQRAQAAEYDYGKAIDLCTVDAATAQAQRKLVGELEAIAKLAIGADAVKAAAARQDLLDAAAAVAGPGTPALALATTEDAVLAQLVPVRDKIETMCDAASVTNFAGTLKAAGVPVT